MSTNFDDFVSMIRAQCPILSNEAIRGYKAAGTYAPITLHAYRLAAYIATVVAQKAPADRIDDDDWQDAVNECMLHCTKLINDWRQEASFNAYAGRVFYNIILRYIWALQKGGVASAQEPDIVVDQLNPQQEDERRELTYADPPSGLRDPMIEAMAMQDLARAEKALTKRPASMPMKYFLRRQRRTETSASKK